MASVNPMQATVVGLRSRITTRNFYPGPVYETLQSPRQLGAEGRLGQSDTC